MLFRQTEENFEIATLNNGLKNDTEVLLFCNREVIPTLTILTGDNSGFLFFGFTPYHIVLLLDSRQDNNDIITELKKSAEHNRYQESPNDRFVHLVYYVDEKSSGLNEIFGVTPETSLPKLMIVNVLDSGLTKYLYNSVSFLS